MGKSIIVVCNNCAYDKRMSIGKGKSHTEINLLNRSEEPFVPTLLDYVKKTEEISKLREMLKDNSIKLNPKYGYEILKCNKCNELDSNFLFEVTTNSDILKPNMECYKCKGTFEIISMEELKKSKCPVCGNNLEVVEEKEWD